MKAMAKVKRLMHDVKVGEIFYATWGYEQTNVYFFEVVRLVGSTMVELKRKPNVCTPDGDMTGKAVPGASVEGEPMRRKVGVENYIKMNSYTYARQWHGRPVGYSSYA
jgi:hypothetical protein